MLARASRDGLPRARRTGPDTGEVRRAARSAGPRAAGRSSEPRARKGRSTSRPMPDREALEWRRRPRPSPRPAAAPVDAGIARRAPPRCSACLARRFERLPGAPDTRARRAWSARSSISPGRWQRPRTPCAPAARCLHSRRKTTIAARESEHYAPPTGRPRDMHGRSDAGKAGALLRYASSPHPLRGGQLRSAVHEARPGRDV